MSDIQDSMLYGRHYHPTIEKYTEEKIKIILLEFIEKINFRVTIVNSIPQKEDFHFDIYKEISKLRKANRQLIIEKEELSKDIILIQNQIAEINKKLNVSSSDLSELDDFNFEIDQKRERKKLKLKDILGEKYNEWKSEE